MGSMTLKVREQGGVTCIRGNLNALDSERDSADRTRQRPRQVTGALGDRGWGGSGWRRADRQEVVTSTQFSSPSCKR
jgi:hypothetical protein